jgi:hypothetical protein
MVRSVAVIEDCLFFAASPQSFLLPPRDADSCLPTPRAHRSGFGPDRPTAIKL